MISNILFKKPVPVGALFLSDDHLESVHRILADLVYVENETKTEGSNIMQVGKDIPIKEAYGGKPSETVKKQAQREPNPLICPFISSGGYHPNGKILEHCVKDRCMAWTEIRITSTPIRDCGWCLLIPLP